MEENGSKEVITSPELTPELAADLLFISFGISQGDPRLQADTFQYLHLKYPSWLIQDEDREKIVTLASPKIARVVYGARDNPKPEAPPYWQHTRERIDSKPDDYKPIDDTTIHESAKLNAQVMQWVLSGDYNASRFVDKQFFKYTELKISNSTDETLSMIADKMRQRDDYFKVKGRPTGHFQKYVVKGETTGSPFYDQMMQDIKKRVYPSGLPQPRK